VPRLRLMGKGVLQLNSTWYTNSAIELKRL
jgi:hypothetical protein